MKLDEFDLSDANLSGFFTRNDSLFLVIDDWREKKVQIEFPFFQHFKYEFGDVLSQVEEVALPDEIIDRFFKKYFEKIPDAHEFKLYRLIDIDDHTVAEIISHKLVITGVE
ncbi:MAG: hypothetical protein K1000chlam2_00084 [Chlamydiae bacterium]|nr:hypothetical protein [Chlamydiota bacterium]